MRNTVFTLVALLVLLLTTGSAFAQTGVLKGNLAPRAMLSVSHIEAGQYRFTLEYGNNSEMDAFIMVNNVLVGIIGNFATDPNPSHREQVINIPNSGMLTAECVHITGDGGGFSLEYKRLGAARQNVSIDGLSMTGRLEGSSNEFVVLNIPQGIYDISCAFDAGENDVDWTLYSGKNGIFMESGTSNPDTESGVKIPVSGQYTFNVRNLRENPVNFTLTLKPGIPSTGTFSNGILSGMLQSQGDFEINIPLAAGTYNTALSFDTGDNDVDWSLYDGNLEIGAEYGVDNPDLESGIVVPKTGTYRLVVRNLRDNLVNYRLEFKK